MSQQLINRSPDLLGLQDDGYSVQICEGFLVVSEVPYVDANCEVQFGTLVSELTLAGDKTAKPETHVIHFKGKEPCHKDGKPILQIRHAHNPRKLTSGVSVDYSFSNKPSGGYSNYHEKVVRYVEIISGPACSIDSTVSAKTFGVVPSGETHSAFTYADTNSSRAEISGISDRFKGQRIAIIGAGGTGAYVLDQVAKTPVSKIRLFDGDEFLSHNAFRCPGAASLQDLRKRPKKVDYLKTIYSNMHKGIEANSFRITESNLSMLEDCDFVFICIDSGSARKTISEYLLLQSIPFIDVGMGVEVVDGKLLGLIRSTAVNAEKNDHVFRRLPYVDSRNDEYATNIQIADLNMENAALAIIKWKKMIGFYHDAVGEMHSVYTINTNKIIGEDEV